MSKSIMPNLRQVFACLVVLAILGGCGIDKKVVVVKQGRTSAEQRALKTSAFYKPGQPNGSQTAQPKLPAQTDPERDGGGGGTPNTDTGLIVFSETTQNICSVGSSGDGKYSVKAAIEGVDLRIYSSTAVSQLSVQKILSQAVPPIRTMASQEQAQEIRNNLINKHKLEFTLPMLPVGAYLLVLTDHRNIITGSILGRGNFIITNGKIANIARVTIQVMYDNNRGGEQDCDSRQSPLVIDLDNSGIDLSSPHEGVEFDIMGGGSKNKISWPTKASSVFLALDLNQNGRIDDVHELFGNNTRGPDGAGAANGFEALRKYDLNSDGVIDPSDAVYWKLRLWSDINKNAVSEPGELVSLVERGVESISLDYIEMDEEDSFGNSTRQRSLIKLFSGDSRRIVDIWFRL